MASPPSHSNTITTKPRLPVDRGWAWWVMVGYFINMFIGISWIRAFAILLPIFLETYKQSTAVTTLAFGISELAESVGHVLLSLFLMSRFSVRSLSLFGAVLNISAILSLCISPNIVLLNMAFGMIGFARAFLLNPQISLLSAYFKKRLSFASAVGSTGLSMATLVSPLLTQLLLTQYGLEGTYVLFAGIASHSIIASMLFRPTSLYSTASSSSLSSSSSSSSLSLSVNSKEVNDDIDENKTSKSISLTFSELISNSPEPSRQNQEDKCEQCKYSCYEKANHMDTETETGNEAYCEDSKFLIREIDDINHTKNHTTKPNPSSIYSNSKDIEDDQNLNYSCHENYKKSKNNEIHLNQQPDNTLKELNNQNYPSVNRTKRNSVTTAVGSKDTEHQEEEGVKEEQANSQPVTVWAVLRNPTAVFIILAVCLGTQTQCGNVYMPVLGLENGLDSDQLPWLLTIAGISDIIGKMFFGLVADRRWIRPINLACLALFNAGLVFQLVSYFQGMAAMVTLCIIFGFHGGIVQTLQPAISVEYVGVSSIPHITSGYFLANCILTFLAHLVVGSLKDVTGSFTWGFSFLGGLMLAAAVLLLIARWCSAYTRSSSSSNSTSCN